MEQYVYYRPDGEIIRASTSPKDIAEPFIVVDRGALANPAACYVKDQALVEYTPMEAAQKQGRPHPSHTWSNATMEWVDARSLEDLKTAKWAEIRAARDAAEFGGFTWDGDDFDSDVASQARIMGAVQMATLAAMAEQPFSIEWTLATNIVRTLDGAGMVAVGLALGAHVAQQHETGRSLRAAIEACTTAAEVEAISWPA